ncbi:hypothetical protein LTS18_013526, partial [Coniosporium uncinatum]
MHVDEPEPAVRTFPAPPEDQHLDDVVGHHREMLQGHIQSREPEQTATSEEPASNVTPPTEQSIQEVSLDVESPRHHEGLPELEPTGYERPSVSRIFPKPPEGYHLDDVIAHHHDMLNENVRSRESGISASADTPSEEVSAPLALGNEERQESQKPASDTDATAQTQIQGLDAVQATESDQAIAQETETEQEPVEADGLEELPSQLTKKGKKKGKKVTSGSTEAAALGEAAAVTAGSLLEEEDTALSRAEHETIPTSGQMYDDQEDSVPQRDETQDAGSPPERSIAEEPTDAHSDTKLTADAARPSQQFDLPQEQELDEEPKEAQCERVRAEMESQDQPELHQSSQPDDDTLREQWDEWRQWQSMNSKDKKKALKRRGMAPLEPEYPDPDDTKSERETQHQDNASVDVPMEEPEPETVALKEDLGVDENLQEQWD